MKKTVITSLMAAVTLAATAVSFTPLGHKNAGSVTLRQGFGLEQADFQARAAQAPAGMHKLTSGTIDFYLCGDPYSYLTLDRQIATKGTVVYQAFEMNAEVTTQFAGNKITGVDFFTSKNSITSKNRLDDIKIFLTYDLQEEPFMVKQLDSITQQPSMLVYAEFDEPYTIEAGKPVYVGVAQTIKASTDNVIVIDYAYHTGDEGGWIGLQSGTNPVQWMNISEDYGFVCVGARITGDKLPSNCMSVEAVEVMPVQQVNTPFEVQALVVNYGADAVSQFVINCQVGDEPAVSNTYNLETAIGYGQGGYLTFDDIVYTKVAADPISVKVTITAVQGADNTSLQASASSDIQVLGEGEGYDRTVVLEEFTGTWCQYCPIGITAMEYVRENYSREVVIPVCGHNADEMAIPDYQAVIGAYGGGLPSGVASRMLSFYPEQQEAISAINTIGAMPAVCDVQLVANYTPDYRVITYDVTTEFAFNYNGNAPYRLELLLTQDEMGPYEQTNGYSGRDGNYYGWQNQPQQVSCMYNDVVRMDPFVGGLKESLPATIVKGEKYTYHVALDIDQYVTDKANINAVVYVVNTKTGAIENAASVNCADFASVASPVVDADAPAEYYNLQGMRVAEPTAGVYIRRQGAAATKVLVK